MYVYRSYHKIKTGITFLDHHVLYVAIEYIVANLLLIAYVKQGTSKANS